MRRAVLGLLGSALLFGSALAGPQGAQQPAPRLDGDMFVRGVALGLFATDPDWDYGPLVDEIAARGATDVLVVVNAYQSNRFASDIEARPGRTPSDASVTRTLRQVRERGMRAAMMPVVRLEERAPHEWRGVIAPADGLDAWFASYRRFVLPLLRIAAAEGAHRFVVGSELGSLERYESRWRALIEEARAIFPGLLTYSANWDHAADVQFWGALDEVGLTAYFPLSRGAVPTEAGLARAWQTPLDEIRALERRVGKPVLITEIGYSSRRDAAARPWDDSGAAEADLRVQQQLYRGFCDAFIETPSISGFYVWNWFGFGGPRDPGFTPRGKPAATELAKCFARDWPAPATAGNRT
jgi:hypothetical protein